MPIVSLRMLHFLVGLVRDFARVSSVGPARDLCRRRGRECLAWLMSQGPVMLLGPIGFGGARVFRKICSAATWATYWRFAHFVSAFFACRICERSCPHSIAAPAALRYHDKNCFKRALKCILRSNKQEKAPSIIKKGRIHGFSHLC